jgi:hypothetical protein
MLILGVCSACLKIQNHEYKNEYFIFLLQAPYTFGLRKKPGDEYCISCLGPFKRPAIKGPTTNIRHGYFGTNLPKYLIFCGELRPRECMEVLPTVSEWIYDAYLGDDLS